METKEILGKYYENYDEDGRLRSRHGMVEFLTTMRYVRKYLRPGMRILEIGAATGRYSHSLARDGYQVDAVELLEHEPDARAGEHADKRSIAHIRFEHVEQPADNLRDGQRNNRMRHDLQP